MEGECLPGAFLGLGAVTVPGRRRAIGFVGEDGEVEKTVWCRGDWEVAWARGRGRGDVVLGGSAGLGVEDARECGRGFGRSGGRGGDGAGWERVFSVEVLGGGRVGRHRYAVSSLMDTAYWSLEYSDEVRESVEMMKGMQVDDMQKDSRLLMMAREVQNNVSLSRDLFAEGALGSAVVAMTELSFSVGCSSEGWRGIVETIVSAMVSMTSSGGVPEVSEDVARISEYKGVACGLKIAMRRREECIGELKALGDCEGVVETVRFMEGMQQDDMEKCDCSLLLIKEMQVKAREKFRFILKLTGYVVD
ncbi:hypothetical protein Tco_0804333 [Tanacetum coccineum]|uniref:Uncharacterized protein n=1 Tax=Tanacetum coccineum TaxID=301880 RepID=A0ABQ5A413_9ASTR